MSKIIKISQSGDFRKSEKFLKKMNSKTFWNSLHAVCQKGIRKLEAATPKDTGLTALSWDYTISLANNGCTVWFTNDNMADNVPVAILIQYGHGTRNGAYVQGRDYINPTMRPIFDEMAKVIWGEVTS